MKTLTHFKIIRKYNGKAKCYEFIFCQLILIAFFVFFAVLRDELVRWAGAFCLKRNIVFSTSPVAALAAVLAALNLNTKLCDEFPPEARFFYKMMGFKRFDFVLLELLTVLFRGAAEALFLTVFRYGLRFSWYAVLYFFEVLLFLLASATALFHFSLLKSGQRTRRGKETRIVNKIFFHNKYLSFFYGDFTAGRKVPDLWADMLLIFIVIGACVYFQVYFSVGAYLVVWLSAAAASDCYRYDGDRVSLFRVLRMNRAEFLRHKFFDLFLTAEFFLAVYTAAALARGTVNPAAAAVMFLAMSAYGAVLLFGANLVCIRDFPKYSVGGSILYALLSLIPFLPLFLAAFLYWKTKKVLTAEL